MCNTKIRAQMQQEFLRNAQAANRIGIAFAPNNLVAPPPRR
jgi:hypothetical protein